jgi:cephalosporin hydroxylase
MTLDQIGIQFKSDKTSQHHNYLVHYERHFEHLKNQPFTLVELGYGGYEYKDRGGSGARTWLYYFGKANVISIDLYKKTNLPDSPRFTFYQASQDDELLASIITKHDPDVFIDDASHVCDLTIKSFEIVFPLLKSGAWYVIEDIEGSFWNTWSKGTIDYTDFTFPSPVNLGRKLINDVNKKYIPDYKADYPIESIHFYSNLIFIKKA